MWDIDDPYLYTIRLAVLEKGQVIDEVEKPFGFREAHFAKDGKSRPTAGRSSSWVWTGIRITRTWARPSASGCSTGTRKSCETTWPEHRKDPHYPQSPHFLDRCGQLGLLCAEEIPGWSHIGDEAWKDVSLTDLREMILRDRHHPSIVLAGRADQRIEGRSRLYARTNQLAHELDPSVRQTGGVRCHRDSELLEDVFTYNDLPAGSRTPTTFRT